MPAYMLDTNIVSHLIRDTPGVRARVYTVGAESIGLSVITEAELRFGLRKRENAARARALSVLFDTFEILDLNRDAAKSYGDLRAALESRGQMLAPMDTLIAAHAIAADCTLITDDAAFARIDGLHVDNWLG